MDHAGPMQADGLWTDAVRVEAAPAPAVPAIPAVLAVPMAAVAPPAVPHSMPALQQRYGQDILTIPPMAGGRPMQWSHLAQYALEVVRGMSVEGMAWSDAWAAVLLAMRRCDGPVDLRHLPMVLQSHFAQAQGTASVLAALDAGVPTWASMVESGMSAKVERPGGIAWAASATPTGTIDIPPGPSAGMWAWGVVKTRQDEHALSRAVAHVLLGDSDAYPFIEAVSGLSDGGRVQWPDTVELESLSDRNMRVAINAPMKPLAEALGIPVKLYMAVPGASMGGDVCLMRKAWEVGTVSYSATAKPSATVMGLHALSLAICYDGEGCLAVYPATTGTDIAAALKGCMIDKRLSHAFQMQPHDRAVDARVEDEMLRSVESVVSITRPVARAVEDLANRLNSCRVEAHDLATHRLKLNAGFSMLRKAMAGLKALPRTARTVMPIVQAMGPIARVLVKAEQALKEAITVLPPRETTRPASTRTTPPVASQPMHINRAIPNQAMHGGMRSDGGGPLQDYSRQAVSQAVTMQSRVVSTPLATVLPALPARVAYSGPDLLEAPVNDIHAYIERLHEDVKEVLPKLGRSTGRARQRDLESDDQAHLRGLLKCCDANLPVVIIVAAEGRTTPAMAGRHRARLSECVATLDRVLELLARHNTARSPLPITLSIGATANALAEAVAELRRAAQTM